MNLPLSSPHVHSQFCDGRSSAEDMVQAAIAQGFVSLGISSHAVQNFDLPYAMKAEEEGAYIAEVRRLKRAYAGQIRLWLGIERDLYSTSDRNRYEYVIGSVHYLGRPGQFFAVDGDREDLLKGIDAYYGGDAQAMACDYYRTLGKYIAGYRPDIIGHFDLVVKHSRQGELFDPLSAPIIEAAQAAMRAAVQGCRLMEVNTGALGRGRGGGIYPSLALLSYWRELGGEVILASDCHQAAQIACGYEEGLRLIKDAGYTQIAMLGSGDALFERLPI